MPTSSSLPPSPASPPTPAARALTIRTGPDPTRADAGLVAVTEFQVDGPDQQEALFAASRAAWDTLPWPATLLSVSWLASLDGRSALAYAQWRDDSGFEAFGRTHRPILAARFRQAVPALIASPPVFYRHYRSSVAPDAPVPGCIVAISVEFDGPDETRQRAWVDAVFDALAAEPQPPAGGIGAHFHLSTDGTRVFNYALWVDEASHKAALERAGTGAIGTGPKWRAVQTFPGLKGSRVTRHRFDRRLVPPDGEVQP